MAGLLRLPTYFSRIAKNEAAPGIVLMACAAIALAIANSPLGDRWHELLHHQLGWTPITMLGSIHDWINDGLMAVFFLVVGLELKREILAGALADARQRRLPVIAAILGMAFPAAVYLGISHGDDALQRGWAIPAATDIAFAMGILALVGKNLPPSIRLFLLTVAIVDDLGAVLVIAIFYTSELHLAWLLAATVVFLACVGMNRFGVRAIPAYLAGALLLWFTTLQSGVHSTVAGLLAAITIPLALNRHGDSPLLRLEHLLVPINGFLIVPLFGLSNAGVALDTAAPGHALALPLAIAAGLFVGKQVGILLAVIGCERLGIAARPEGATLGQVWGMAMLCGIGFTMSLFIAGLAFPDLPELGEQAKLGILGGSLLSAIAGTLILRISPSRATD